MSRQKDQRENDANRRFDSAARPSLAKPVRKLSATEIPDNHSSPRKNHHAREPRNRDSRKLRKGRGDVAVKAEHARIAEYRRRNQKPRRERLQEAKFPFQPAVGKRLHLRDPAGDDNQCRDVPKPRKAEHEPPRKSLGKERSERNPHQVRNGHARTHDGDGKRRTAFLRETIRHNAADPEIGAMGKPREKAKHEHPFKARAQGHRKGRRDHHEHEQVENPL